MKFKGNEWIFIFSCIFPLTASAANVGLTTINITGSILPSSCTIATGKNNLNVYMGSFGNNTLTAVGQVVAASKQSFDVSLTGCNDGIIGTVMTFSGSADTDEPALLALSSPDADGTAKGLAIRLSDNADNVIDINKAMALQPLVPGDNTITFNLAYQVTKVPVTAGDANAVLYLDLAYQ